MTGLQGRLRLEGALGAATVAVFASVFTPAAAGAPRLPDLPAGGPPALHAAPPAAPELQNHNACFRATYELVSGTERYARGEYLYTDYLYDDTGATYPADSATTPRHANNAADLVEFRAGLCGAAIAYRFTLNTLLQKDATIATVAFDSDGNPSTGNSTLPRDPGMPFPGTDQVLTTWGTSAEWSVWTAGKWQTTPLSATTDARSHQIIVVVPDSVAHPTGKWAATLAVGLHDPSTGGWLAPGSGSSKIYNLGFRFNEHPGGGNNGPGPDAQQNAALSSSDPTAYEHAIDFDALRARVSRDNVPTKGVITRMFASRLHTGQGHAPGARLEYLSQLQPYTVYVPKKYDPSVPEPLTLFLHSLNEHYYWINDTPGETLWGEQRNNIIVSPGARGVGGWYEQWAEYDVFEAWNDAAHHYNLDPTRTDLVGYSMGGYGTYRLGTLYPDLFARAATIAGPPGEGLWAPPASASGGDNTLTNHWLENARNLPFFNITDTASELVPYSGQLQQNAGPATDGLQSFDSLGYRFRWWSLAAEHFFIGDDFPEIATFFGDHRSEQTPFHVTYARMPANDDPDRELIHNHAYWLSRIEIFDPSVTPAKGVVDATSLGFGLSDPTSSGSRTAGVDAGSRPYVEQQRTWSAPGVVAVQNKLNLNLTNVAKVSVDLDAARLSLDELTLNVNSTTPAQITLTGSSGTRTLSIGSGRQQIAVHD